MKTWKFWVAVVLLTCIVGIAAWISLSDIGAPLTLDEQREIDATIGIQFPSIYEIVHSGTIDVNHTGTVGLSPTTSPGRGVTASPRPISSPVDSNVSKYMTEGLPKIEDVDCPQYRDAIRYEESYWQLMLRDTPQYVDTAVAREFIEAFWQGFWRTHIDCPICFD